MTITIAGIDFDYHDYDERGDVLYLTWQSPRTRLRGRSRRPRGVGLELMGVRSTLERDGDLQVTWPPAHLAASTLRPALAA